MLERMDNGQLAAYAWPGGYPVQYLIDDGESICPDCANGENGSEASEDPDDAGTGWMMVDAYIHWEGPSMLCAHCNERMESAYGNADRDSKAEHLRELRGVVTPHLTIRERNSAIRAGAYGYSDRTGHFGEGGMPCK